MTFTADNTQPAGSNNSVVENLPLRLHLRNTGFTFSLVNGVIRTDFINRLINTAAQHNVGPAAGHIGRDGHHTGATRFQNNLSFAFMLLGIEDIVGNAFLREQLGNEFGIFNRGRPEKHRLLTLIAGFDVFDNGGVFFFNRTINLILLINTNHFAMSRDNDRFQTVNILEFIRFRIGRPGHTGELFIHTEKVLERNGSHGLVFLLDLHPFLGFHSLMKTFAPATSRHQTAGKLVNNNHFSVLNNVMLIALEERMRSQRSIQMMHQNDIFRRVERFTFLHQTAFGQDSFQMLMTGFGDVDLMSLFIDPVIPFALFFQLTSQESRNIVNGLIEFRIVVSRSGNNQRRTGFVNQNRVNFVNNGVVQRTLTTVIDVILHVVAQIVKAELVIRPVRNIRGVRHALLFGRLTGKDLSDT
ncbi:hypothetical protein EVA_05705 [gut metagenome]|uniref:Uncharacterized protein n=1 Tax=gut metagenome TaxID=749906 RepID=J9GFN9_9ZZZZ